ncbi:ABC transporter ATP-binding protein [Pararhodobacter sp. CCB-MM2]|uniref:ABC transporter ATP-binding protein n=1 Tax=Pararhodobacter sp. CCB-MM2 TaxID=1786003 RepID=UPI00082BC30B|nr:ABC transporter ATP-binding protein [Pararhodobacter sp. CCB-MM2]
MTALAKIEGLEVFYGASQALFGVDLTIEPGQAVALMGRNGMGKSTTIKALSRMHGVAKGKVFFDGREITALPSYKAARLGIGLVPEGRRCFATLTVDENLIAAARPGPWTLKTVRDFFPRLGERADQQASTLSGGEQQMLAIGRALMTNPRLLILDEATEGLAPVIRAEIWASIKRLKAQGQSILIVDKTLKELKPIADHCVILERGRTAWTGTADQITPEIESQYLGL